MGFGKADWLSKKLPKALKAVEGETDQEKLAEIAMCFEAAREVRLAAAAKITDPAVIERLLTDEAWIKTLCKDRMVAEIADHYARTADPQLLLRLLETHSSQTIRESIKYGLKEAHPELAEEADAAEQRNPRLAADAAHSERTNAQVKAMFAERERQGHRQAQGCCPHCGVPITGLPADAGITTMAQAKTEPAFYCSNCGKRVR